MPRIPKFYSILWFAALLSVALYNTQSRAQGMFDEEDRSGGDDQEPENKNEDKNALFGSDRSYPSASIGIKAELFALEVATFTDDMGATLSNTLPAFSRPVAVEGSFDIMSRLSVFGAFGMYTMAQTEDIDGEKNKMRAGVLMFQGGARFSLMEPRTRHAHLYVGADFTGAVGIATEENDGEDDDDAEKIYKEQLDHLIIGMGLGIEYLVSSDFGVATEFGFRILYNDLEDIGDVMDLDDVESYRNIQLFTALGLRLSYHF